MAELFRDDFEEGNLTDFDSTVDSYTTFDAFTGAKKTGTYGCRMVNGTGFGQNAIGVGKDDVYAAFHLYIDSNTVLNQFAQFRIFRLFREDFSTHATLSASRESAGSGPPTHWVATFGQSTTNFALDTWMWVVFRGVCNDAVNSGVQLWVDGDSVGSVFNLDWSAGTYWDHAETGNNGGTLTGFLYFDNVICNDAEAPTEPTDAGGIVILRRRRSG